MTYIEDESDTYPLWKAMMFVVLIFVTQVLSKLILENAKFYQLNLGAKASQALGALVYCKTLRTSPATNNKYKKGDIVNFIQVDAKKLIFLAESLPSVARLPLTLVVSSVLLFAYLKVSFLSGLFTISLFVLINYFLAKLTMRYQTLVMKNLDIRMNIMTECLDNIQLIKLNAWENQFTQKIDLARKDELSALFKRFMMSVVNNFMIYSSYPILAIVTFFTAILGVGDFITVPVAVASIQSLNLLKVSSRWLPFFIGLVIEFLVSMERIQEFLNCEEVDLSIIETNPSDHDESSIEITNSNFFWGFNKDEILERASDPKVEKEEEKSGEIQHLDSYDSVLSLTHGNRSDEALESSEGRSIQVTETICLQNIDIKIKKGDFVAIIGEVGSGKSSFIHSLIGDMIFVDEYTKDRFKSQFFANSEDNKDKDVLDRRNTDMIKKFNESLESNMNYIHSNCPVKVNGTISLIEQKPWIQNKSIRENILFGKPLIPERYNKVIEVSQLGRDLEILEGGDMTEIGEKGVNLSGGQKARISIARAIYSQFDIVLMDDPLSALDAHVKNKVFEQVCLKELQGKTRILVTHAIDFLDKVDRILVMEKGKIIYDGTFEELKTHNYFKMILEHMDKDEELEKEINESDEEQPIEVIDKSKDHMSKVGSTITVNENEEESNVEWKLYVTYFLYNKVSLALFIFFIFALAVAQTSSVAFDVYLLKWIQYASDVRESNTKLFVLIIVFSLIFMLFLVVSTYLIFKFSIILSKNLFKDMNKSVFNAPINMYFDRNPTGLILNRFSKDINRVDNAMP